MIKIVFYLLLAGLISVMAACGKSGSDRTADVLSSDLTARGGEVYLANCATCHGINGEGQNPAAPLQPDETGRYPAPPHNGNGHTWHHDDDLLIRIIKEGGMGDEQNFHEMPAFGDKLSDEDIHAVLTFIKTLWTDEQRENQHKATEAMRSPS